MKDILLILQGKRTTLVPAYDDMGSGVIRRADSLDNGMSGKMGPKEIFEIVRTPVLSVDKPDLNGIKIEVISIKQSGNTETVLAHS